MTLMRQKRFTVQVASILGLAVLATACAEQAATPEPSDATVFEGARLIVGDGSVVDNAVFVVDDGSITAAGAAGTVEVPEGATHVDLSGRTVMPALVNAHFHLSSDGAERIRQLRHLAYYGSSAAISLGLDDGVMGLVMRGGTIPSGARSQSAGRGITSPEPGRSEVPHWVTTQDEAREAVQELAAQNVDFVKVWVDSRGGQYERLSPELYGAVIDEAHANGLRVTAHVFTLEDAKGLLEAGVDAFAHGVRDMDVDDAIVEMWTSRPDVVLVPNLPGPGVPVDVAWLGGSLPAETVEQMASAQRENPSAQAAFGIQARNLVRLHEAGVKIAFGTDGGSPWAVHQELEDMVRAGMSPSDVIVAATKNSAELLRIDDLGTIAPGMSADFVVLDANPLDDITNTRRIAAVWIGGHEIDRASIGAQFRGE